MSNILKSYGRQVRTSGEVGALAMDVGSTGSGLRDVGAATTGIALDYMDRLEKETTAAQISSADTNIRNSWTAAEETIAGLDNAKEVDDFYNKWETDQKKVISDTKMTPRARRNINEKSVEIFGKTRNKATGVGGYAHNAQTKTDDKAWSLVQVNSRNGISATNPDTGEEMSPEEANTYATNRRYSLGTITELQRDNSITGFKEDVQKKDITKSVQLEPTQTIDKVDKQLSGAEITWPDLSVSELKSAKSYAKIEVGNRQRNAAESLYDVGNEYQEMTRTEKEAHLTMLREGGAISAKSFAAEMKKAIEPSSSATTPKNNTDWIEYTAKIRDAGKDEVKQGQILSEIGGLGLPLGMKEQLYSISKDVLDPMSSYNKGRAGFAFEQIDERFDGVMTDEFKWQGWFGDGAEKKSFNESRGQIQNKAKYEAETIMTEWLRTEGAGSPPDEIQKKVNDVMLSIEDKYNLKNYKTLLENIEAMPEENSGTVVDDDIADDYINNIRNNR